MARTRLAVRCLAPLLLAVAVPGLAQDPPPQTVRDSAAPQPSGPRVTAVAPRAATMGDRVRLRVDGLPELLRQKNRPARDLVLYLDGRALKEARAEPVGPAGGELEFRLLRSEASRDAWNAVLAKPGTGGRVVTVSTGFPDERELPPAPGGLRLDLLDRFWLWVVGVFLLLVLGVLAHYSDLLRDPAPTDLGGSERRPYSLARFQMAFWFCVVLASYLFLLLVTRDHETLNAQSLVLLGIGAATLLAAAGVDAVKRDQAREQAAAARASAERQSTYVAELEAEHEQLGVAVAQGGAPAAEAAALPVLGARLAAEREERNELERRAEEAASRRWPASEWFLKDLLTDANGISLHRFQMLVWTLVLGSVFLYRVYTELAMPEFSATLLALLGISSGVYVGLKVPEQQMVRRDTDPPQPPADGAPAAAPAAADGRIRMGFGRERPTPVT
ncbi:MAG TPA: hypothetical protein VHG51_07250 [Longimicrobiaceae bacterium]|nr:hypothetical protein [Longimicrobiaceae bacterium]